MLRHRLHPSPGDRRGRTPAPTESNEGEIMMRVPRRRLVATAGAVAAAAALVLSGCSTGAAAGGNLELSEEPVTLNVTWWGSDARAELTNEAIAAFEEEY